MADSSAFQEGTRFRTSIQLDTESGTAYGMVEVAFDRADYPDAHPVDASDLADALRDFLTNSGYTVQPFTGPMTTELDWPQEV